MKELYKRIEKTEKKQGREITYKLSKFLEEGGELVSEILTFEGKKPNKKNLTRGEIHDNILEEATDGLLVILSILTHYGFTLEEIIEMANKKCDIWEEVIKNESK